MSEWVYLQGDPSELLTQYHHFSMVKRQGSAVPPPGQRVRFYAEADKPVNQKTASFVPCGWGSSIFAALGDCVRLIRQFPFEGEDGAGS